jgi:hypothetical protein
MTLHFACDPAAEGTTARQLEWMQSSTSPCFALVDMALLDARQREGIHQYRQWSPVNAYATTSLAAFGEHAPHLLTLSDDPQQRSTETAQLLQLMGIAPALSWIRSAYPVLALQQLFGYLGKVQVEGSPRPAHCRFADVRIFPSLLDDLAPTQQLRIAEVVETWSWVDRDGQWRSWKCKPQSHEGIVPDSKPYLHLSVQQIARLRGRAEPDRIYVQLMEQSPDTVPDVPRSQLHKRLQECLGNATALHLTRPDDRYLFVQLCLDYGNNFHRYDQLAPIWTAIRDNGLTLAALMPDWPEELWDILRIMSRDLWT